jgi:hypothetical protein
MAAFWLPSPSCSKKKEEGDGSLLAVIAFL